MKRWRLVWKLWVAMAKRDDPMILVIVDEIIALEQEDIRN